MRISVRASANVHKNVTLPSDFQGPADNDHGRRRNAALFGMAFDSLIRNPLAPRRDSRVSVPQAEKKTLPGVVGSFSDLCSRYRDLLLQV